MVKFLASAVEGSSPLMVTLSAPSSEMIAPLLAAAGPVITLVPEGFIVILV